MSLYSAAAQDSPLKVVASTSLIADVARNVGGDWVTVTALVPPDSDIHAFEPAPQDALLVAEADVVLVNGVGLEGFLGRFIEQAGGAPPVVVSSGIDLLPAGEHRHPHDADNAASATALPGEDGACEAETDEGDTQGDCDPHVWTDPRNVMIWAENIAAAFAAADPANASVYRANADAYIEQLTALDAEVRDILSAIPDEARVLVTNHEFLAYFAHAYDFEIVGVVAAGGTTLSDPDPQALAELIEVVSASGVPAIFAEMSSTTGLAETVAQESGVTVVTRLYSDSLSSTDGPAATYLDYLRYNARAIADALGG